jgi:hypothetical protein
MKWIRRRTNCRVPGHGTGCLAVWENGASGDYYRPTEERMAMEYELAAEYGLKRGAGLPADGHPVPDTEESA